MHLGADFRKCLVLSEPSPCSHALKSWTLNRWKMWCSKFVSPTAQLRCPSCLATFTSQVLYTVALHGKYTRRLTFPYFVRYRHHLRHSDRRLPVHRFEVWASWLGVLSCVLPIRRERCIRERWGKHRCVHQERFVYGRPSLQPNANQYAPEGHGKAFWN